MKTQQGTMEQKPMTDTLTPQEKYFMFVANDVESKEVEEETTRIIQDAEENPIAMSSKDEKFKSASRKKLFPS